jgi:hypothetical protein
MVGSNLQSLERKTLLTKSLSERLRKIPVVGWVAPTCRDERPIEEPRKVARHGEIAGAKSAFR